MALIEKDWIMTVTLQDKQGDTVTKTYELQATDLITAQTASTAIRAELNTLTNSNILSYNLINRYYENVPSLPADGDNSVKARISARGSDAESKTLDIPAPVEALFAAATGSGNNVVLGTAVADYLALFVSGGSAFISDGEFLVANSFIDGERVTVAKRRKRR